MIIIMMMIAAANPPTTPSTTAPLTSFVSLVNHHSSYNQFQCQHLRTCNSTLVCDMSTGLPRPYVPSELHHTVFNTFHLLSHPGIRATQHLITARYVWPNINSDIHKWAQSCLKCQQSKVQRHTVTHLFVLLQHQTQDLTISTQTLLVHYRLPMGIHTFSHVLTILHFLLAF